MVVTSNAKVPVILCGVILKQGDLKLSQDILKYQICYLKKYVRHYQ